MKSYRVNGEEFNVDNDIWEKRIAEVIEKIEPTLCRIKDDWKRALALDNKVQSYVYDVIGIYNKNIEREINRQVAVKYPVFADEFGFEFD